MTIGSRNTVPLTKVTISAPGLDFRVDNEAGDEARMQRADIADRFDQTFVCRGSV